MSRLKKKYLGRGWAFPFGFDTATGGLKMSETEDNIRQSIHIILATRPGERQMLPKFGCRVHELLFAPNTSSTAAVAAHYVRDAIARWEPRVEVKRASATPDATGGVRIEVEYNIVATNTAQSLVHLLRGGA